MNYRLARLIAVITTSTLIVAACSGGSSTSSRSRNSVLAGGPCITVAGNIEDVAEVKFCAGAVKYSQDNGETQIDVPNDGVQITADMWPAAEGKTSKISIMSYDQTGVLVGDDVVTRTVKNDCESGSYCTTGDSGPNGGTVVVSKAQSNFYYEIMPATEKNVTNDRINATEAAAVNIDAPWQMPSVVALSDILNSIVGETISDSRLVNFRFEAGVSAVCDNMKQEKYCLFHPYWTKDSDSRFAPSTLPSDNDAGEEQISTIGYDLWDYQGNDSIKQFCPLSDTSRSAECLATLLPVHVYSPEKPSVDIAVEQVDRDRWQELCTGAPEITIGDNAPQKNFSITVTHPCIRTASEDRPISLVFKVLRMDDGEKSEVVGDLGNEASDPNSRINITTPGDGTKVFNYNLPEGRYLVKTRILFPRIGALDMSEGTYFDFNVGLPDFFCAPADLVLTENQLSTTCEDATGLALHYVYGVDTEPRFSKPSESVVLEMPDGWHMFEVTIFGKTSQFGLQMWGCLKDCGPKAVDGLTVTAAQEDVAIASTTRLTCEEGIFTLIGQGSPNGNPNLLSYVGPREVITSADQVIAKPASGAYMYMINSCDFDEERLPEMGLVFVETPSSSEETPTVSKDVIARTQVMEIDRNDGNPVIAPAINTTMEIVMDDMKDVASLSISINGSTTKLLAGAQPTLINIPRDATLMKITTKKTNGAVEVYTKAISRPAQLPVAASAAPDPQETSRSLLPLILAILVVAFLGLLAFFKFRKPKESL